MTNEEYASQLFESYPNLQHDPWSRSMIAEIHRRAIVLDQRAQAERNLEWLKAGIELLPEPEKSQMRLALSEFEPSS